MSEPMGEFQEQARKYIATCTNVGDRAYILALAVALDAAHARVESLTRAAHDFSRTVSKFADNTKTAHVEK